MEDEDGKGQRIPRTDLRTGHLGRPQAFAVEHTESGEYLVTDPDLASLKAVMLEALDLEPINQIKHPEHGPSGMLLAEG